MYVEVVLAIYFGSIQVVRSSSTVTVTATGSRMIVVFK